MHSGKLVIAFAVTAAALLAAGCAAAGATATGPAASAAGQDTAAPTTSQPAPGAGTSVPSRQAIHRCHTSDLTGHVEGHGGGAGQRYAVLGLTNRTSMSCTVKGYPGLQLADEQGRALPTTVRRDAAVAPKLLVVKPDRTVWALLHWTVVPADDEVATHCAPDPAALRVIPPDETTRLTMAFHPGAVCQHGQIAVDPFGIQRPADG
jgi:Protein of unknown function (DUF4232)